MLFCISLEEQPGPCPKAALLVFDCSILFPILPLFPDQQLFELALWNLGKVMEAEAYLLKTRNRGQRKASVLKSPTRSYLASGGNQEKGNLAAYKVLREGVPSRMGLDEDINFHKEVTSDHQLTLLRFFHPKWLFPVFFNVFIPATCSWRMWKTFLIKFSFETDGVFRASCSELCPSGMWII